MFQIGVIPLHHKQFKNKQILHDELKHINRKLHHYQHLALPVEKERASRPIIGHNSFLEHLGKFVTPTTTFFCISYPIFYSSCKKTIPSVANIQHLICYRKTTWQQRKPLNAAEISTKMYTSNIIIYLHNQFYGYNKQKQKLAGIFQKYQYNNRDACVQGSRHTRRTRQIGRAHV